MATIDSPGIPGREDTALGYVVASDLAVDLAGTGALEAAFKDRLGEVEDHDGFLRLEVWRDNHHEGAYQMITWWTDETAFRIYMGSDRHRRSHARIPTDPAKPRGVGLRRVTVVAR